MVLKYRQYGHYYSIAYYTIDIDRINQLMKDNYDMSKIGDVTEEDIENCINDIHDDRGLTIISQDSIFDDYYSILYGMIYEYREQTNEDMIEQNISYEEFDSIIEGD